jgi:predicted DNA-binding transcriptional regulator YafY
LYFWGRTWTLGGWCELREGHRNFRLDRITEAHLTDDTFPLEPPVTLDDYLRAMTTG